MEARRIAERKKELLSRHAARGPGEIEGLKKDYVVEHGLDGYNKHLAVGEKTFEDRVREILETRPVAKILDVGCMSGKAMAELKEKYGNRVDVHGLSLADFGRKISNFTVGDAEDLPYKTGSFDLVVSHNALYYVADKLKAVKEMHRVLRPGGTALIHLSERYMSIRDGKKRVPLKKLVEGMAPSHGIGIHEVVPRSGFFTGIPAAAHEVIVLRKKTPELPLPAKLAAVRKHPYLEGAAVSVYAVKK